MTHKFPRKVRPFPGVRRIMGQPIRRDWAVLALGGLAFASTSACSGSSWDAEDDSEDRGGYVQCRPYAVRMATTSEADGNSLTECDFDRGLLTLTCTHAGLQSYIEVTKWDTIVAAVNDGRPLGRTTFSLKKFDLGTCSISEDYIHGDGGRLTAINVSTTDATSCGAYDVAYDAWDSEMRPTHGTGQGVGVIACSGVDMSSSYDETTRTIGYRVSGGIGDDCQPFTSTVTLDPDGLPVSSTTFSDVSTHTIEERGEICID